MERKLRYVWWIVLVLLIVLAIWKLFLPHGSKAYINTSEERGIVVYIAGAVEKPGLLNLPINARLDDALKQMRLLPEANTEALNPAEKLKDGQKITIPFKPQTLPQSQIQTQTQITQNAPAPSSPVTLSPNSPTQGLNSASATLSSSTQGKNGLININTADQAELDKLPNIGPALAEAIIQYRNEHGFFTKPEDLTKVSGIGPKTYEKMAPYVTVGP